ERHAARSRVVATEGADRLRIELGAGLRYEDGQSLLVAARTSVCTPRGDRVECVGYRDDSRAEGDLVARETVGIPGSVQPFVVVQHHRRDIGIAEGRRHLRSVDWVPLDDRELRLREAARLVQHL